jgi:hypothetical protein
MSAAEIIELIKKLPPEERAEVMAWAKSEAAESRVEEPKVNYLPQAEAERRAEKIFRENHELFRRLAQ